MNGAAYELQQKQRQRQQQKQIAEQQSIESKLTKVNVVYIIVTTLWAVSMRVWFDMCVHTCMRANVRACVRALIVNFPEISSNQCA